MTQIVLIRHGVTDWNREGRIQGHRDIPLSEEGRALLRARSLPVEFAGFDRLASPLARCRETAEILFGGDFALEPRLKEMCWGSWEGQRREDLRADPTSGMAEQEVRGLDLTPPGGESPRQLQRRVLAVFSRIAARRRDTVAVTHRGVIRATLALALGWEMRDKPPVKLDWACAHLFRLDANGNPTLERPNIRLHTACAPASAP